MQVCITASDRDTSHTFRVPCVTYILISLGPLRIVHEVLGDDRVVSPPVIPVPVYMSPVLSCPSFSGNLQMSYLQLSSRLLWVHEVLADDDVPLPPVYYRYL